MDNLEYYSFYMPRETWIGPGSIVKLGESLNKKGVSRCLLITDEFMSSSEAGIKTIEVLEQSGIEVFMYKGVKPDPTTSHVAEGMDEFLKHKCEALVSLGGGSPHDCAKTVKYLLIKGNILNSSQVVLACVNTTAGTGSEITRFAVIKDENSLQKIPLIDELLIPDVAIDDSNLMIKMPKSLTAETGMDALTHAIEAYVSKNKNYITSSLALKSIELIDKYLVRAYEKGDDIESRDGMAYAQYMAGMAFSNAGLGKVHALAHQIGGRYKLSHGLCNAVLLPFGVKYNLSQGCDLYGEIAIKLNLCPSHLPLNLAAKKLVEYLAKLNRALNIPLSLKDLNVKLEDCDLLAEMAMNDATLKTNPANMTIEDMKAVYTNAYYGKI